jgi:DNA-binding GntR family transcriptional regulator
MAPRTVVEQLQAAVSPVERETLNDRVYRELKSSIMAGAFKPGSELTLRVVADALGTSFMPVRDALRRLVAERALEVRPSRKIAIPMLSAEQFLELRRIRVLLEGEAVGLAAERMSKRELAAIQSIMKKLRGLDDSHRDHFWQLNKQLHFAAYEAARSPMLLSMIETLWLQIGPLLTRIPAARALTGSADPHELLLAAFEKHDPEAARRALEADLTHSTEQMLSELTRQQALRV